MDDAILARADALMQRRRPAVADSEDLPVLTDVALPGTAVPTDQHEDDIPILTTAVDDPPPAATAGMAPIPGPRPLDTRALTAELAARIERRIVAELPRLIDDAIREVMAEQGATTLSPDS